METVARIGRDVCLIAVGLITFLYTPDSLLEAGIYGLLSNVWSAMLGFGALASMVGVIKRHRPLEITGCSFVGGGFLVWTFAALTLPNLTPTAIAVALVFLSGMFGQLYRVAITSKRRAADRA